MKSMKRLVLGTVLLALCGSLLAGCGGSKDDSSTGATGATKAEKGAPDKGTPATKAGKGDTD